MAKKGVSIKDIGDNLKGINFDIFGGFEGFLSMTSGTSTGGGGSDIAVAQQLRRVVPWLAKAVDMTANAVSALPFDIVNEKGDPYDSSTDWKNKTGGLESPENLFYLLASSLCFGRAYVIPQTTSRGIVDLQFVAPQTVIADITRDGLRWFDRTTDKGAVSRYYPVESELDPVMVYFWLPDSDIEIGPALTHPAGTALMSAQLLFNMDGTIATYASRGFIPPTVLGAKGMPGPAERMKAERWWDRFFRGKTDIAAKIINTEALSVVKVGAGMEDLRGAYPELTKQMIENIATAFGIPSGLFMSDMAFATEIKHLTKVWYTTSAFVKVYKAIETGFNEQILSEWGLKLRFDPNAIDAMQEEEMERAQAFSTYVNAGMRPSVVADMLGLELPEGVTFEMLDADLLAKQEQEQKLAEAQAMRFQQSDKGEEKPDEKKPVEKEFQNKMLPWISTQKTEKGWVTIDGNHVFVDSDSATGYVGKDTEWGGPKRLIPPMSVIRTAGGEMIVDRMNGWVITGHYRNGVSAYVDLRNEDAEIVSIYYWEKGKEPKSVDPLSLSAEQIKELNLWRQIAERNWRKGKGACMDFEVKTLPADMADEIRERLKYATGKEDIGQAFEVTGTPQERGMDNEAIKALADAINRATDAGVNIDNPA